MDQTGYISRGMCRRDRKLYEAAITDNVQVINEIGGFQGFANEVMPDEDTALHMAAYHGSLRFVRELLQLSIVNGEDGMTFLRAKNREGNTALHEAALGGKDEVVNSLVQSRPDLVNEINKAGESALFKACEGGHAKIVEMLCDRTPMNMEYSKRFDGQTLLHLAVSKLNRDVIEVLFDKRPELATEVDIFNRSPLHMAAAIADSSIMSRHKIRLIGEMLIEKDSDSCYRVDQNKQSALHIAAKEGNAALVEVTLKNSPDSVRMVDNDGRNALHLAVNNAAQTFQRVRYRLKTIICLVTSERLINCSDKNGQTALDIAIQNEDEDPQLYRSIIGYLYERGAIRNVFDTGSTKATKSDWKPDAISVSAVLIATVAFAAAFTLPGGTGTQGQDPPAPILINTNLFKLFVIFDTVAFCYSIASAILVNFAFYAGHEDPIVTEISVGALWISLVSLSLTFGAAIHLVVASKCLWLAVLVWVMVCILPICIRALSLFGKPYLFTPLDQHINFLLMSYSLVFGVVIPFLWVGTVVFFFGMIRPSLRRVWKKQI